MLDCADAGTITEATVAVVSVTDEEEPAGATITTGGSVDPSAAET
jgi:hypothetical protein